MNHASKPWLITPLLVCHAITCGAAEPALRIQPLETIRAAAAQAVRAAYADSGLHPVLIDASSLDPRLRLPACGAALQAQLLANAPGAARQVVIVRCETTSLWTVRVPTQLQTEISGLTLTRALSKGALVTSADVVSRRVKVPGLGDAVITDLSQLAQQRLRGAVSAGALLQRSHFEADFSVRRGQTVNVLAIAANFEIQVQGVALQDAKPGQRLRVQNSSSLKIVDGVADSLGNVHLQP